MQDNIYIYIWILKKELYAVNNIISCNIKTTTYSDIDALDVAMTISQNQKMKKNPGQLALMAAASGYSSGVSTIIRREVLI